MTEENKKLRGLLWYAWNEFNIIRARDGAPLMRDGMQSCSESYWSILTDEFAEAIGPESLTPWPSSEAKLIELGHIDD